jgi:hypothetical protein
MERLVRLIAARSGGQLVINELAGKAALANHTVARHVSLLQEIFLIRPIPAWSRKLSTRVTGTPKVAVTDLGIAASLVGVDTAQLKRPGSSFGPLLEGFALVDSPGSRAGTTRVLICTTTAPALRSRSTPSGEPARRGGGYRGQSVIDPTLRRLPRHAASPGSTRR